jgi:hypothetical protein
MNTFLKFDEKRAITSRWVIRFYTDISCLEGVFAKNTS